MGSPWCREGHLQWGPSFVGCSWCVSRTRSFLVLFFSSQAPGCFYEQPLPFPGCPSPVYFLHRAELAMSLRMLWMGIHQKLCQRPSRDLLVSFYQKTKYQQNSVVGGNEPTILQGFSAVVSPLFSAWCSYKIHHFAFSNTRGALACVLLWPGKPPKDSPVTKTCGAALVEIRIGINQDRCLALVWGSRTSFKSFSPNDRIVLWRKYLNLI